MRETDEYLLRQPKQFQEIALYVIADVNRIVPDAKLMFKWGIPFFYYNGKPFCYVAPNHKKKFVDVGFLKGFELKRNTEHLISEKRTVVKSLRYSSLIDIDALILEDVLLEALSLHQ